MRDRLVVMLRIGRADGDVANALHRGGLRAVLWLGNVRRAVPVSLFHSWNCMAAALGIGHQA